MDLYNIGAMVGIPGLASVSGFDDMEEFRKEIAKKKKSISKSDLEDERERLMEKGADATKSLDMSSAIQEVQEKTMESDCRCLVVEFHRSIHISPRM